MSRTARKVLLPLVVAGASAFYPFASRGADIASGVFPSVAVFEDGRYVVVHGVGRTGLAALEFDSGGVLQNQYSLLGGLNVFNLWHNTKISLTGPDDYFVGGFGDFYSARGMYYLERELGQSAPLLGPRLVGEPGWSYGREGTLPASGGTQIFSVSILEANNWDARYYLIDRASGVKLDSGLPTNSNGRQFSPEASPIPGTGAFFTIWTDDSGVHGDTTGTAVIGRVYEPGLGFWGPDFRINVSTGANEGSVSSNYFAPHGPFEAANYAMAPVGSDRVLVTFLVENAGTVALKGVVYRFDPATRAVTRVSDEIDLGANTPGNKTFVTSAPLRNGMAVVGYTVETGGTANFYASVLDQAGAIVRSDILVAAGVGGGGLPGLAQKSATTALATWQSNTSFTATDFTGRINLVELAFGDSDPPTLSGYADIAVSLPPGAATAVVNYPTPTATDAVDGPVTPTLLSGPPSGSAFPVGTTTVMWSATDRWGNAATASFDVVVTDDEAPTVTVPGPISVGTDPGSSSAVVTYAAPTASDNVAVGSGPTLVAGLPSGSAFPLGVTTVTFEATDTSGNTGSASFNVVVTDDEAPVVNVPGDIVVETLPGMPTATVVYETPTATDNVGVVSGPTLSAGLASGAAFPVGTTTVTWSATDAAGNTGQASFDVTVERGSGTFSGTEEPDVLDGGSGPDDIAGLGGSDVIRGGGGNDRIDGGTGADQMFGGPGDDHFVVDASGDAVIELPDEGYDTVESSRSYTLPVNVEALVLTGTGGTIGTGNEGPNQITGNAAANGLNGRSGDDVLEGGAGADRIDGGAGSDTVGYASSPSAVTVDLGSLKVSGGDAARDTITNVENVIGSGFDDKLTGSDAANRIFGLAGRDRLTGRRGADTLAGGPDADEFIYGSVLDSTSQAADTLVRFKATEGDIVDLSAVDAIARTKRNDAFVFIGDAPFSGRAGELRFAGGQLLGDVNGDRVADLVILVETEEPFAAGQVRP
jgi:Ca2+-binding RTX toxin-like protein